MRDAPNASDTWNSPKWSDRDLSVIKLRHDDERARWDSMMSQIGRAMGLPHGANFAACLERAQELALERAGLSHIRGAQRTQFFEEFGDEILERGSR